jgi:UDP-N-acetylglucosamine--N-acetylmuramyl-(pentapeptide) pyrophosphoryl-undecaprenol N-acetylglucosamine transferase
MSKRSTHIVFSGGGTGGHLFPGLAVSERLSAEIANLRVTFAGSGKAFERKHVLAAGYEYLALPCRPLPGKPGEAIPFVVENLAGYFAARRFLKVEGVDAVVGLGGYASVPMGRAAVHSTIPLALLEQNVIPGRATRWLSKRADLICTSFDETENYLSSRCAIRNTGNPVRKEFFQSSYSPLPLGEGQGVRAFREEFTIFHNAECANSPHPNPLPKGEGTPQRLLLILGGSGGARSINENVPRALYKLNRSLAGWKIVHQTGEADCAATQTLYRKLAIDATVLPFIHDLSHQLSQADLIVCRAGGTTLAELAAKAVPAVLIPFPAAKDDHQRKNARVYAEAEAAAIVEEPPAPGRLDDALAEPLESLLTDAGRRQEMSAAMACLARPYAAEDVAELVWSLVCSRSWRAKLEMAA